MTFEQNRRKLNSLVGKWRVDEVFKILLFEDTIKDNEKQKMIIGLSAQFHSFIKQEKKGTVDAPEKRKNDSRIADSVLYVIDLLKEEDCNIELLNKQLQAVVIIDTEKEEEKLGFLNWLQTANRQVIVTGLLLLPAFVLWLWAVSSSRQFMFEGKSCSAMQVANFVNPILQMLFSLFAMINASLFRRFDVENDSYQGNEENIKKRFLPSQSLHFKDWLEFKKSSNIVVRQFVTYWRVSWGAWLTLYGLILIRNLIETHILPPFWGENTNSMIWIFQDLCKNISTFTYFLMFYVLTMYVTDVSEDRQSRIFWERIIYAVGVALLFFIVEFVFIEQQDTIFVIRLITSLTAGVMLMLVFARLTSKIIALPIFFIVFMCFYAVLQPMYSLLDIEKLINVRNPEKPFNVSWLPTSTGAVAVCPQKTIR